MPPHPIDAHRFADRFSCWLAEEGPDMDVVVSCRTRLARNLEGFPFISRLAAEKAEELCARLRSLLVEMRLDGETVWVSIPEASPIVRLLLRERHLVSRDLAPSDRRRPVKPGRGVAFGETETISVMINEEDHLRLQGLAPGFDLDRAWRRVQELDLELERHVAYAFSRRLGYLTGCPSNVGTGLRASVMLHLPALGMAKNELDKVITAAQRTGLAVRGMYGEGSRAGGDFYQISNQVTLGRTEQQLVEDLKALVPCIVDFERRVRQVLLKEQRTALHDRIMRSYGNLRSSTALPTDVALTHLSHVRLGVCLGMLKGVELKELNRIAVQIQKGHVQALSLPKPPEDLLEISERDRLRASFLRQRFAERS